MNTKRLQEMLAFWQPILRLQDWDIEVRAVSRKSIDGDDGECYAYPDIKEAEIKIVSGRPSSKFADHETILVHELTHCHLEPIRTDENNAKVETATEAISKAFVGMVRKMNGKS